MRRRSSTRSSQKLGSAAGPLPALPFGGHGDRRVSLEGPAARLDELDELGRERRVPAGACLAVAEGVPAAGANAETEPGAAEGAAELAASLTRPLELVCDDGVERYLGQGVVENLTRRCRPITHDLLAGAARGEADDALGPRESTRAGFVEVGRVLEADLYERLPVVLDELVAPVLFGEGAGPSGVEIGEVVAHPARVRPVQTRRPAGARTSVRLAEAHDLEAVADAQRRAGDVAAARIEGSDGLGLGEVGADRRHVVRARVVDAAEPQPVEVLEIRLTVHEMEPFVGVVTPKRGAGKVRTDREK